MQVDDRNLQQAPDFADQRVVGQDQGTALRARRMPAVLVRDRREQDQARRRRAALFDRDAARGMRLDIAAGTAVRFEPGQSREVNLIPVAGKREIYGFNQKIMGALD